MACWCGIPFGLLLRHTVSGVGGLQVKGGTADGMAGDEVAPDGMAGDGMTAHGFGVL